MRSCLVVFNGISLKNILTLSRFEVQLHTIPTEDYNQHTMRVMFNVHSSDIIKV